MTVRSPALQHRRSAPCPKYNTPRHARGCQAVFPSGKLISVDVGRARSYPGLTGPAPRTEAIYEALTALAPSLSVLDLGSGSGQGCQILSQHFSKVRGVESDPAALGFAREYAPVVEFQARDAALPFQAVEADVVCVIDLLAHVHEPDAVLRAARSALAVGGRIVVAEPRARVGTRMAFPQRRGFAEPSLQGALIRAGFTQVRNLAESLDFIVLVAEAAPAETGAGMLVRAVELARTMQTEAACDAFLHCVEGDAAVAHEARLALADMALAGAQGDAAASLLVEAREACPEDPRVWTSLGRLSLHARDASTAVQCAVEALEREPCDAPAALLLAESLQALEHPQASEAWGVASRLAPADVGIATRLARLCASENDYDTGINALLRAAQYAPVDADFKVVLGWLLLLDQRVTEALRQAKDAWLMAPGSMATLELLNALGEVLPSSRVEA